MIPASRTTCLCGEEIHKHICPANEIKPDKIAWKNIYEIACTMALDGVTRVRVLGKRILDEIARGGYLP